MRVLLGFIMIAQGWAFACGNSFFDNQPLPWYSDPAVMGIEILQRRLEEAPSDKLPEFKAWYREQRGIAPGAIAEPEEDEYLVLRKMLTGNHEAALKWITEGIARNEKSHYGSEWLHRAILEAKVAMEQDPDYLKTGHILPVEEEEQRPSQYFLEYGGKSYHSDQLLKALYYQLGERMLFVKPKDPVVADLLYTLALVEVNARVLKPAVELLQLAKEYGYHDVADIDARLARYQATIDSTWKVEPEVVASAILGLVLLSLPLILIFIVLRGVYRLIVLKQAAGDGQ